MPGLEVWCKTLFVFIHMYIIQSEKNNNNISLFCVVTYECVEENIHAKPEGLFSQRLPTTFYLVCFCSRVCVDKAPSLYRKIEYFLYPLLGARAVLPFLVVALSSW